ncbi:MAG: ComEA family DNA-binding protein [bacterium]
MSRSTLTTLITLSLALIFAAQSAFAQDMAPSETRQDTSGQKQKSDNNSSTTGRIIPPEEFGKYRDQKQQRSELSKDALIEKLRADSASMRLRFRETMREVRADSKAMRKIIQRLRRENKRLSRRLARELNSDTKTTERMGQSRKPDSPATATPGTSAGTEPNRKESMDTQTKSREEGDEAIPQNRKFNPNEASSSDLKSIPELSDRLAERIQWYRREVRPFKKITDLMRVPGIDRSTYDKIKGYFLKGPY